MSAIAGRVALRADGQVLTQWTAMRTARDLKEIAGGFELEYLDTARSQAAGAIVTGGDPAMRALSAGMPVSLLVDGEMVLDGYIDDLDLEWDGRTLMRARVLGRDKTGDLVDCAAAPDGPDPAANRRANLRAVRHSGAGGRGYRREIRPVGKQPARNRAGDPGKSGAAAQRAAGERWGGRAAADARRGQPGAGAVAGGRADPETALAR